MKISRTGSRIRERRNNLGLTAEELAEKAGVSREYLFEIEKQGRLPSGKLYIKLRKILNLTAEDSQIFIDEKYPQSTISAPIELKPLSDADMEYFRKQILLHVKKNKDIDDKEFAAELLSKEKSSKIKDANLISKIVTVIKNLRKARKTFEKDFTKEEEKLRSLIKPK